MGKLSSGSFHVYTLRQSPVPLNYQKSKFAQLCLGNRHAPVFRIKYFSPSALLSAHGANNCGFAHRDQGFLCQCDLSFIKPSPREVAVFGKEDNLVTSFTNPGFLFPCSIAFCSEKREAFILDKR